MAHTMLQTPAGERLWERDQPGTNSGLQEEAFVSPSTSTLVPVMGIGASGKSVMHMLTAWSVATSQVVPQGTSGVLGKLFERCAPSSFYTNPGVAQGVLDGVVPQNGLMTGNNSLVAIVDALSVEQKVQIEAMIDRRLNELEARLDGVVGRGQLAVPLDDVPVEPESFRLMGAAGSLESLKEILGSDFVGDGWSDLFDYAADVPSAASGVVIEAAREALRSEDALVRAASGRALSALDPKGASALLEKAIGLEDNKLAKSILAGALRSANIRQ